MTLPTIDHNSILFKDKMVFRTKYKNIENIKYNELYKTCATLTDLQKPGVTNLLFQL